MGNHNNLGNIMEYSINKIYSPTLHIQLKKVTFEVPKLSVFIEFIISPTNPLYLSVWLGVDILQNYTYKLRKLWYS